MANFRAKAKTGPPSPLVRPRPAESDNFVAFSAVGDGFSVYVHRDVLEFIERESRRAAPDEAIGLLAGRVCQDPVRGPYTLVMAADGARAGEVEASPSHVHISAVGHASVRRRLEDTNPDREVVGWYHSHPRYPAHFSPIDTAEQSTWNDPNHVGIVFSGTDKDEPFGVYRGPEAARLTGGPATPRAGSGARPVFRTERPTPPPATTVQAQPAGAKTHAVTIPPPARPSHTRPPIGTPRLFFALLLLALAAAVVWLHFRVSSIETGLRVASASASTKLKPTPTPTPTPTPAPTPLPTPAADSEANAATKGETPSGEQTGGAPSGSLPALLGTPDLTPPANPLKEGKRAPGSKKVEKKSKAKPTPKPVNP